MFNPFRVAIWISRQPPVSPVAMQFEPYSGFLFRNNARALTDQEFQCIMTKQLASYQQKSEETVGY